MLMNETRRLLRETNLSVVDSALEVEPQACRAIVRAGNRIDSERLPPPRLIAPATLKTSHLAGNPHSSVTDKRQRKDALTDPPFEQYPYRGTRTAVTQMLDATKMAVL